MTKEGDHRSLYAALYNALMDDKQIDVLLTHPEFQNRARKICYRIAGKEGRDDLFQEACLQVSRGLGSGIQSDREFFHWFYVTALNAYLCEMRKAVGMKNCSEKAKQWPAASADLSPSNMEKLSEHLDECEYDAELLRAEEQNLRSMFRQAGGFDGRGRILRGTQLQSALAEHERRSQLWKESARRKKLPFSYVALYNDGQEIASCGKFFDLTKHVSLNELDARAGLQIRGISDNDANEDVLLGSYALTGVRHEGDEQFLHLSNGYTVGLKIKKLGQKNFEVNFRCVETRIIEEEQAQESAKAFEGLEVVDDGAENDERFDNRRPSETLPVSRFPVDSDNWLPPPANAQTGALYASLAVSLLVTIAAIFLTYKSLDGARNMAARDKRSDPLAFNANGSTPYPAATLTPSPPIERNQPGGSAKDTRAQNLTASRPNTPGSAGQGTKKSSRRDSARQRVESPKAQDARDLAANSNSQPASASTDHGATKPGNNTVVYYRTSKPMSWRLLLFTDTARAGSERILLTGSGQNFKGTVEDELRRLGVSFESVSEESQPQANVTIDLWASKLSLEGARTTAVVQVTIFSGGHKISDKPLSYIGNGASLHLAYVDALRKASKPVFNGDKKSFGESQSAAIRQRIEEDFGSIIPPVQAMLGIFSANSSFRNSADGHEPTAGCEAAGAPPPTLRPNKCRRY